MFSRTRNYSDLYDFFFINFLAFNSKFSIFDSGIFEINGSVISQKLLERLAPTHFQEAQLILKFSNDGFSSSFRYWRFCKFFNASFPKLIEKLKMFRNCRWLAVVILSCFQIWTLARSRSSPKQTISTNFYHKIFAHFLYNLLMCNYFVKTYKANFHIYTSFHLISRKKDWSLQLRAKSVSEVFFYF